MRSTSDGESVDPTPSRLTSITHGGRRFSLRCPIEIGVDFRDELWTYEYEPLGILAYGASRDESLAAFRTDFAACWDSIAQEQDSRLAPDAQDLKRKLTALVATVEELGRPFDGDP